MQPKHIVDMTERERIADYQRGWNDAQMHVAPDLQASILYFIGYRESNCGNAPRFQYPITVH